MRRLAIAACLLLASCAEDHYAGGSPDAMASDLRACKARAERTYAHATGTGAAIGGLFGGALGGLAMGVSGSGDADPSNIDRNVEACMRDRGYTGTSAG